MQTMSVKSKRDALADYKYHRSQWVRDNPLRKWRSENDISIRSAAQMLSVSASTIQDWEGGITTPNDENAAKIAKAIGASIETLLSQWLTWLEAAPKL